MLAHQASGFLGDAQSASLKPVVRVDAVVFASGHDTLLIVGGQLYERPCKWRLAASAIQKIS
jgi:hypothetical protein